MSYSAATRKTPHAADQFQEPASDTYHHHQQQQHRHQGFRRPSRGGPVIPANEYDFEQANQGLNKDELAAEAALESSAPSYNKKSSFFDTISSETTASHSQKREERKNERSWNYETFGAAYVKGNGGGSGHQRGGGGQGRGGSRPGQRQPNLHHNATGTF
jgi:protein LSM14